MPSQSRAAQVDLEATPYYHCISRCVRRAFLCGDDAYSGRTFDHGKKWIVDRLRNLSSIFAIDVCAYAVMSNHFHLVLRVNRERGLAWSDEEVALRWGKLFKGAKAQLDLLGPQQRQLRLAEWRERLTSLSWMMRSLNEHIARRANREEKCTGRFWEGRFKSQPLVDEGALLTCMAYVDLNPVRAGVRTRLETAEFTSIEVRLREAAQRFDLAEQVRDGAHAESISATGLLPFAEQAGPGEAAVSMLFLDYIALLEWTGRVARLTGPSGRLRGAPPALLERFGIQPEAWLQTMCVSGLRAYGALGRSSSLRALADRHGKRWIKGQRLARRLFAA